MVWVPRIAISGRFRCAVRRFSPLLLTGRFATAAGLAATAAPSAAGCLTTAALSATATGFVGRRFRLFGLRLVFLRYHPYVRSRRLGLAFRVPAFVDVSREPDVVELPDERLVLLVGFFVGQNLVRVLPTNYDVVVLSLDLGSVLVGVFFDLGRGGSGGNTQPGPDLDSLRTYLIVCCVGLLAFRRSFLPALYTERTGAVEAPLHEQDGLFALILVVHHEVPVAFWKIHVDGLFSCHPALDYGRIVRLARL
jgi:hypothetical protein